MHSDYGQRCQICSKSFTMPGNRFQVYVVHIVRPSVDHRTNHLGDLLGLCGWHYSLIRYGEWAFLDPDTDHPFEDSGESHGWEQMRTFMSKAPTEWTRQVTPILACRLGFGTSIKNGTLIL